MCILEDSDMSNFSDLDLHEMRNLGVFFPICYSKYFLVNKWCIFGENWEQRERFVPIECLRTQRSAFVSV